MTSLETVRGHLDSLNHGAHLMSERLNNTGQITAGELRELMRHVHGAIENLTNVVEGLAKKS
ncbi:hypothetical protein [Variovorax sp. KBW07]|uniref:hypothetical protein n=1 Tax=Variovorax sp. KBW07 TaxID=2153358 RepID=UPI000F58915F|nr:hypothetical protein [Variovorax sp. KBW07]